MRILEYKVRVSSFAVLSTCADNMSFEAVTRGEFGLFVTFCLAFIMLIVYKGTGLSSLFPLLVVVEGLSAP